MERTAVGRACHRAGGRFRLVLTNEREVALADEALRPVLEYLRVVNRLRPLARRYWFDVLLLAAVGLGLAGVVLGQDKLDGPQGPLWFDVLATLAIVGPLFLRRRFPVGAPVAVGVGVVLTSFVDERLVAYLFVPFLAGCAAVFLLGLLRERAQAAAGLVLAIGVTGLATYRDPLANLDGFIATSVIFGIVWTIAFALRRKFEEADEAKQRAARAERERSGVPIARQTSSGGRAMSMLSLKCGMALLPFRSDTTPRGRPVKGAEPRLVAGSSTRRDPAAGQRA